MLGLIFTLLLGLIFAFFATQNTEIVTVKLLPITFFNIPIYLIVIASMLAGVLLGSIFHITQLLTSWAMLRGKNSTIKEVRKVEAEQEKKIHDLEVENAKLKKDNTPTLRPRFSI